MDRFTAGERSEYPLPTGEEETWPLTGGETIRAAGWTMLVLGLALALGFCAAAPAPAQSQSFYCSNLADAAVSIARDFETTEFGPEHFLQQPELARVTKQCVDAKEDVKACVVRKCMEEHL